MPEHNNRNMHYDLDERVIHCGGDIRNIRGSSRARASANKRGEAGAGKLRGTRGASQPLNDAQRAKSLKQLGAAVKTYKS